MKNLLLLLFIVSIFVSCEKPNDPDENDGDLPCLNGETPVVSQFSMGGRLKLESNQFHPEFYAYIELDTVITGTIRFWTDEQYDQVQWDVHNGYKLSESREFTVDFNESYHGKTIEVEMYAYNNITCLSEPERENTLKKTLVFRDYIDTEVSGLPIYAEYQGSYEGESEEFTITVNKNGVFGFPTTCGSVDKYYKYFKHFFVEGKENSTCNDFFAIGTLSEDQQTITVNFQLDIEDNIVKKTFVGTRL